jgi:hypothetical protein
VRLQGLLKKARRSKQNIEPLGASFRVFSCRLQPLFPQHLTSGVRAVRMNAKEDILIFIIARLRFYQRRGKKSKYFLPALHIFQ